MPIIYGVLQEEYERLCQKKVDYEVKINQLPKGSLVKKKINGREYNYLAYRCGKKVTTDYIREDQIEEIYEQIQRRKNLKKYLKGINIDMKLIEKVVKKMNANLAEQKLAFWDLIKTLHDAQALEHIIIIGSWAVYLYQESGLLKLGNHLKTHDIDLLVPNVNKPWAKVNLSTELPKQGYELRVHQGLTRFGVKDLLDIEFLVRDKGTRKDRPHMIHSLGVTAQGLCNLDILIQNSLKLKVHHYNIIVPTPEAYILQKLIINENRLPIHKQEKDRMAVRDIIDIIKYNPVMLETLYKIYCNLDKQQSLLLQNTCQKYDIELPLPNIKTIPVDDLENQKSKRISELLNMVQRTATTNDVKWEYQQQVKKIITQNGKWTGEHADIEIATNMLINGFLKNKIQKIIQLESPEMIAKTTIRAKQDSRKIIELAEKNFKTKNQ